MRVVVAAVIEREDRRLLIGQRRKRDSSPLKWEFPGGKMEPGETPDAALARELHEELGVTLRTAVEIGWVRHHYGDRAEEIEIRFFAAEVDSAAISPKVFEKVAWVLPRELSEYDFLAANAHLVANLATGKIRPREILGRGKA